MAYWNKKFKGFTPEMSEDTSATNYTDEQINAMYSQGDVITGEDGEPIVVPRPEPTAEEIKEGLRSRREQLLIAFDKYKSNVQYGIERETQMQHESMIAWYEDLLDLETSAFENVPERIKYYL